MKMLKIIQKLVRIYYRFKKHEHKTDIYYVCKSCGRVVKDSTPLTKHEGL